MLIKNQKRLSLKQKQKREEVRAVEVIVPLKNYRITNYQLGCI